VLYATTDYQEMCMKFLCGL